MRLRLTLFSAALLLAGCDTGSGQPAPASTPTSVSTQVAHPLPGIVADVVMPLGQSSAWRHAQQNMQVPIDVYSQAWSQALRGRQTFDTSVGVAALAESDVSNSFCASPAPAFSTGGTTVVYCKTVHEGPDPLPQSVFVLVPYDAYARELPKSAEGQAMTQPAMAVLLARVYSLHVIAQLKQLGVEGLQPDCVAGLTLRSFITRAWPSEWSLALAFAGKFTVAGLPPLNAQTLVTGYQSGRLQDCV